MMLPELAQYLLMIEDLRAQVIALIEDLPAEALNWRPLVADVGEVGNSLAVLAAHVAGAEHFWMAEVLGAATPTRDRGAEFVTEVTDAAGLIARLRAVGAATHQVLTDFDGQRLNESLVVRDRPVAVRWAILHVIDHSALHLGHMQILYQLWHQGPAKDMPRWFERAVE